MMLIKNIFKSKNDNKAIKLILLLTRLSVSQKIYCATRLNLILWNKRGVISEKQATFKIGLLNTETEKMFFFF